MRPRVQRSSISSVRRQGFRFAICLSSALLAQSSSNSISAMPVDAEAASHGDFAPRDRSVSVVRNGRTVVSAEGRLAAVLEHGPAFGGLPVVSSLSHRETSHSQAGDPLEGAHRRRTLMRSNVREDPVVLVSKSAIHEPSSLLMAAAKLNSSSTNLTAVSGLPGWSWDGLKEALFDNASSWPREFRACRIQGTAGRELRMTSLIGSGADGMVLLAEDVSGAHAAVKITDWADLGRRSGLSNEHSVLEQIGRALPRSERLSQLERGFEDVQTCCGMPCLVMQFVKGRTLQSVFEEHLGLSHADLNMPENWKWLKSLRARDPEAVRRLMQLTKGDAGASGGFMPFALVRSIALQALLALRDMEQAGVCKLDHNLRNFMLSDDASRIVLLDFSGVTFESKLCNISVAVVGNKLEALGAFLEEDSDFAAYRRLCHRLEVRSASEALRSELMPSVGSDAANDNAAFFQLHPDVDFARHVTALCAELGDQAISHGVAARRQSLAPGIIAFCVLGSAILRLLSD